MKIVRAALFVVTLAAVCEAQDDSAKWEKFVEEQL